MRTKHIVTTSLLSAGLILGSVSVANATDPTPTTVTTSSPVATTYAQQLAAYKVTLASPVATTYAQHLAAYKVTLASYQVAMDQYRAAWKVTMDQYNAAIQAVMVQYRAAQQVRLAKRAAINSTFQAAIAKAIAA
jgi:hypothetical protein